MRIAELHAIRRNMLSIKSSSPVEYHLWDAILTVWLMAWVGSLAVVGLNQWIFALIVLPAMVLPDAYVHVRRRAHRQGALRCDWLPPQTLASRIPS